MSNQMNKDLEALDQLVINKILNVNELIGNDTKKYIKRKGIMNNSLWNWTK